MALAYTASSTTMIKVRSLSSPIDCIKRQSLTRNGIACIKTNTCQDAMISVEGTSSNFFMYNVNTVGAVDMVKNNGVPAVPSKDNTNGFASTVVLFTPA